MADLPWSHIPKEDQRAWMIGIALCVAATPILVYWLREAAVLAPLVLGIGSLRVKRSELLYEGTLAWNPPSVMKVAKRERVEVRIGDVKLAIDKLLAGIQPHHLRIVAQEQFAPAMRIRLIAPDDNATITELNTDDQYVEPGQVGKWDFDVTPLKRGRFKLRLLPSIRRQIDGKEEITDRNAHEHEIRVHTSPFVVIGEYWKWFATAIALPVLVWLAENTGLTAWIATQVKAWF